MSSFGRFGNHADHAVGALTICIKPLDGKGHTRKRALTVKSWSTVKDLKDILQSLLHLPTASQRLFFRGSELRNPRTLQDCGIYKHGQTIYLAASPQDEMGKPYRLEPFLGAGVLPRTLARVLGQARRGLDRGFKPELSLDGTGGTYFLQDAARQKVAVFKPQDEEPFAPNNPRDAMQGGLGDATVSMRPGIQAGESYLREVAAFLLDDEHLHGVPATTLVEAKHPAFCYWDHKEKMKLGSFQEFVRHDMVVEDISPSRLTPREVQKIALLDMRILNRDRNSVNILVRSRPRRTSSFATYGTRSGGSRHHSRHSSSHSDITSAIASAAAADDNSNGELPEITRSESGHMGGSGCGNDCYGRGRDRRSRPGGVTEYELIPIDHGLCLSDQLVIDWCDWCWLDWRQIKEPIDPQLCSYIQSLNPEATAEKLRNTLNLREPCLRNLRIAETLIKEGAAVGLSLYDIACIMRREDFDEISELETLVTRATELARAAVDHQASVAPSKPTVDLKSKSLDVNKASSSERSERAATGGDNGAAKRRDANALPQKPNSLSFFRQSSGDDVLSLAPCLRASGASYDSSTSGRGDQESHVEDLRIWPPAGGSVSFSRESSSGDEAPKKLPNGVLSSPARSAESDTDLASPKGWWHENFETIEARNENRQFPGWGDEEAEDECSLEVNASTGPGTAWNATDAALGRDVLLPGVGAPRKLFVSSEEKQIKAKALSRNLERMPEVHEENVSSTETHDQNLHPPAFWATLMAPAGDTSAMSREEKEMPRPGWRRGEAGLVIPEPRTSASRMVGRQKTVSQRGGISNGDVSGGEPKVTFGPRPQTTSPTLPTSGRKQAKASTEQLGALSQGVKIVRSYSYHGLGSLALYDSANRGAARFSLKRRPDENSEQFKACFFRFLRILIRDHVKRRHRSIMRERGVRAARQAAEISSASVASASGGESSDGGPGKMFRKPSNHFKMTSSNHTRSALPAAVTS